jgi:hypothetical protein
MDTSHFTQIPNDLRYVIASYLEHQDVNKIIKAFDIYINFERLILIRYPEIYTSIKKLSTEGHTEGPGGLEQIRWWELLYNDIPIILREPISDEFWIRGLEFGTINRYSLNLFCYYKLTLEYPEFMKIIKLFPEGDIKYNLIYMDLYTNSPGFNDVLKKYTKGATGKATGGIGGYKVEEEFIYIIDNSSRYSAMIAIIGTKNKDTIFNSISVIRQSYRVQSSTEIDSMYHHRLGLFMESYILENFGIQL